MIHPTRILVACMAKSGSTYASNVLAKYFDIEKHNPLSYWGRREQNLVVDRFRDECAGPFVLQMHIKPYLPHVELFGSLGVRVAYLRRNLGDVLVSLDDHVRFESHETPVVYIHDRDTYASQPADDRFRYLIRHALPWYIGFHLMWRDGIDGLNVVAGRYERMVADPTGFDADLIAGLGFEVDSDRLAAILSGPIPHSRFNRGVVGRSLEALSPANRRLLEDMLRDHPEDLSDLIAELPWNDRSGDTADESLAASPYFDRLRAVLRRGR